VNEKLEKTTYNILSLFVINPCTVFTTTTTNVRTIDFQIYLGYYSESYGVELGILKHSSILEMPLFGELYSS